MHQGRDIVEPRRLSCGNDRLARCVSHILAFDYGCAKTVLDANSVSILVGRTGSAWASRVGDMFEI